jgi:SAM-dependent methyltransferase
LFARYFLAHARLPAGPFRLLDVGCGTGSAVAEMRRRYPQGSYFGCDGEEEHVRIAREWNGGHGEFYHADARAVTENYDVIYVSNVLEHIADWRPVAEHLAQRCRQLYVLAPFGETLAPADPSLPPGVAHLARFDADSFDFLAERGVAHRVIRTPGAWGHPLLTELRLRLRPGPFAKQREILFRVGEAGAFRGRLAAALRCWRVDEGE